jgi:hypothetical protein
MPLSTYFSYIVTVSLVGGGNRRKPSTCRKSLTTILHNVVVSDKDKEPYGAIIPIPIPFYVPVPVAMYSQPTPIPFPFPIPIKRLLKLYKGLLLHLKISNAPKMSKKKDIRENNSYLDMF